MNNILIANFIYNFDSETHKWSVKAYLSNDKILVASLDNKNNKEAINTLSLELNLINQIQALGFYLFSVNVNTYYFKK